MGVSWAGGGLRTQLEEGPRELWGTRTRYQAMEVISTWGTHRLGTHRHAGWCRECACASIVCMDGGSPCAWSGTQPIVWVCRTQGRHTHTHTTKRVVAPYVLVDEAEPEIELDEGVAVPRGAYRGRVGRTEHGGRAEERVLEHDLVEGVDSRVAERRKGKQGEE